MVECESCQEWANIDDTPFSSTQEAQAGRYTCNLCTRLAAMQASIALQEIKMRAEHAQQIGQIKAEWEAAQAEAKIDRQNLHTLLSTERNLREKLEEEVVTLQTQIKKLEQTSCTQDPQENGDQATSTPRHDSGTPEPKHPSDKQFHNQWKEDTSSQDTSRISEDIEHTGELAEEGNPWTQVGKKGRPLKTENTSQTQQQLSSDHKQKQKHTYPQMQPKDHPPQRKRTVVLGDSNAHRLKKHLRKAIHDQRLRITTKSGANLEETLQRAEGEIQNANATNTELQLIIHVGTTDVLNKADIEKSTDQLKQQLTYWSQKTPKHHYIVCAIPEPKTRGQQIATACQTWNTAVQTACTALGPSVRFISTAAHLTEDHLNDIHYSEQAADQVGNQLGEAIKSFLWDKQPTRSQHWRRSTRPDQRTVQTLLKAMTTALGKLGQRNRHW
ncbi:uncharacterized protein LOC119393073 [Rhipicephalus sanguineus]|uniref:uncharacterized protein LOC119393073 n=1 Tax=Rhipicephalus sanguineus TaxID=34632 RepID=UPI001894F71D|nr:uncharacterized protein LOC119393073 [Rhipicephalus sanguineus]